MTETRRPPIVSVSLLFIANAYTSATLPGSLLLAQGSAGSADPACMTVSASSACVAAAPSSVNREFEKLATNWENETAMMSLVSQQLNHPDYLRIIKMGRPVVPLILERLPQRPHAWLTALEILTDENPAAGAESVQDAVARWTRWGKEHAVAQPSFS